MKKPRKPKPMRPRRERKGVWLVSTRHQIDLPEDHAIVVEVCTDLKDAERSISSLRYHFILEGREGNAVGEIVRFKGRTVMAWEAT